jgi:hypothetical protein
MSFEAHSRNVRLLTKMTAEKDFTSHSRDLSLIILFEEIQK